MGALGGHRLGVSQRQAQGDAIPTPLHALRLPPNPHAPSSSPASSMGDAELTLPSLAGTREVPKEGGRESYLKPLNCAPAWECTHPWHCLQVGLREQGVRREAQGKARRGVGRRPHP